MEESSAHFFEGTEKLLEVWFSRQDETKGNGDLRTIPRWANESELGLDLTRPDLTLVMQSNQRRPIA